MTEEIKRSKVELIKEKSHQLAGNITAELADDNLFVSDESYELLKFHGSYQGYDRDTATERKKAGLEKEWEFMLRMKAPAGRLSAEQYLALDTIAEDYANGTLRITTRETFQFHCIIKENLKKHIAAINELMLTTLGGCGDVVRNVMASPAPYDDVRYKQMQKDAHLVSDFTMPKTKAYETLWLKDGEIKQGAKVEEPLYGEQYLTRKFKIGFAIPEDNSIDVLTHDLGFILVYEGEKLLGYNVYAGGGLGMTHNKAETYPRLASPIGFVQPDELLKAVEAVVKFARDHGDRGNRKHARLKYVIEEKGVQWSTEKIGEYFGKTLDPVKEIGKIQVPDHMGWHEQGNGKWFLGVPVPSGRIIDREEDKIRTALREVVAAQKSDVILTADQNIIICDVDEAAKDSVTATFKKHGVRLREDMTHAERFSLACVALPTCGKALAEAERVQLPLAAEIDIVMAKHDLSEETISIRIAGCPNGCSRPYVGDIGIVGRTPDHYAIFIGGDFEGTRLNSKILDRVPYEKLPGVFDVMFARFAEEKVANEGYGDFADRVGIENVRNDIITHYQDEKWAK